MLACFSYVISWPRYFNSTIKGRKQGTLKIEIITFQQEFQMTVETPKVNRN
jgi:hypothetical protein